MTLEEIEKAFRLTAEWQERTNKMIADLLQTTRQAADNAQIALQVGQNTITAVDRLVTIVDCNTDRLTRIEAAVESHGEASSRLEANLSRLERIVEDYVKSIRNGKGQNGS